MTISNVQDGHGFGSRVKFRIFREAAKLSFLFFIAFFSFTSAAEKIESFDTVIRIRPDALIEVQETISYDFGSAERHGIFRDIPTRYRARGGKYNLRISAIRVTDENGTPYRYAVSQEGRNTRIKIGDPEFQVTSKKSYVISYTIGRAINYFSDYDELYWNVTGNEWPVEIERATASVVLPERVLAEAVRYECFVGVVGSRTNCSEARIRAIEDPTDAVEFSQGRFTSGEGFTIVVGFPKGLVREPTYTERFLETTRDNGIIVVPFLTFFFLSYLWYTRGRDPAGRGTIIPEYDVHDNLSPAEAGTVVDEFLQSRDISAEIISFAVKGYLRITRLEEKKKGRVSNDYQFEKLKSGNELERKFEQTLFKALFQKDISVTLSDIRKYFLEDKFSIESEVYQTLVEKGYFPKSPRRIRWMFIIIAFGVGALAIAAGGVLGSIAFWSFFVSSLLLFGFSFFMPSRTRKGVFAQEHILGLKRYLTVVEKERLRFHNAPEKNPALFERLLPYAMALGVEEAWAKQFEGIYREAPSWYQDPSLISSPSALAGSLHTFSRDFSAISYSTAADGGSGFSGGGSSGGSGGGFGGGGGGSW